MKLINVNKNGTLKFQLEDGRFVLSYNSGYVRMDNGKSDRLYQMNRVKKINLSKIYPLKRDGYDRELYFYERILIHCPKERYEFLLNFENKNCKTR